MNEYVSYKSNLSLRIIFYSILEVILIGIAIVTHHDNNISLTIYDIFCNIVPGFILLHILCDIIIKLCNLIDPNVNNYGIQRLELSFKYKIVIGICIILIVAQTMNKGLLYIIKYHSITNICLYCFTIILFKTFIVYENNEDLDINKMNGLDFGTGMAYSYYYGYLRIVLPSTGTTTKGIIEKLDNLEDSHNIRISIKKLFILIPSSTHIPPNLKEHSDGWIENAPELEKEVRDRAGVRNRSYRNTLYKIYPGGKKPSVKPEYIVVEGATVLQTMFEIQKHSHKESSIFKKYRKQIIKTFYLQLKDIIYNDPDCRNLCELIYYDDYNSDGTKVNVAKVILDRISKLKSLE